MPQGQCRVLHVLRKVSASAVRRPSCWVSPTHLLDAALLAFPVHQPKSVGLGVNVGPAPVVLPHILLPCNQTPKQLEVSGAPQA